MMFLILHHIKKTASKVSQIPRYNGDQYSASSQLSLGYNYGSRIRTFGVNDPVWLLVPHQEKLHGLQVAKKLDSDHEGIKGYSYIEISNEKGHCKLELCIAPYSTTRHFKYSWHNLNSSSYYSSIILGSFSIQLFLKLCWYIELTPKL